MPNMPSSEPLFQTAPPDRSAWWRVLRRLVGRVYGIEVPEVECPPEEVARVEAELSGKPLPPAVTEWMHFTASLHAAPKIVSDTFWRYSFRVEDAPANEALVINRWNGCAQWAIPYRELTRDDPPLWAFDYVQKQNGFVHRKSYGQAPLTHYALHLVLNYSPWLDGWIDYSTAGCALKDPEAFVETLRATDGALVSPPFGSLTFIEGEGWLAWVIDGWSPWGKAKVLYLRARQDLRTRVIPQRIREQVGLRDEVLPE